MWLQQREWDAKSTYYSGAAGVVTNAPFAVVAGATATVVAGVAVIMVGDAVPFGMTDLVFVFTATCSSNFPLLLP